MIKKLKKVKESIVKFCNNKYFVALLIVTAPFLFILALKFTYAYIPGEEVGEPKDWISFAGGYLGVIGAVCIVWYQVSTQLRQKEKEIARKEALKKLGIINFSIIFFEDIKNYLSDCENEENRLEKHLLLKINKKKELVDSMEIKKISFFDEDLKNIFLNNFNLIFDEPFVKELIFSYKKAIYFEENYNKNLIKAKDCYSIHSKLIEFKDYKDKLKCFRNSYKTNKKQSKKYLKEIIIFLKGLTLAESDKFKTADVVELSIYYQNLELLLFAENKNKMKISNVNSTIECVEDLIINLNKKKEEFKNNLEK